MAPKSVYEKRARNGARFARQQAVSLDVVGQSAQVGLQDPAAARVLQAADGFLLDLTHALAREVEASLDFFEGQRVFSTDPK